MANKQPLYSSSEYADMILIYGECNQNCALALRTYRERYGASRQIPNDPRVIYRAFLRLRENRPLDPRCERPEHGLSRKQWKRSENVIKYFKKNPKMSLRQCGRNFKVHNGTINNILKRQDLQAREFKREPALLPRDKTDRLSYCEWLMSQIKEDSDFLSRICWTDESTFTSVGMRNHHNLNSRAPEPADQFSIVVWGAIHGDDVIGPVFIDGGLTGKKFINLLNETVSEYTNNLTVDRYQRMWYQLDGSSVHSVLKARKWLNNTFGSQWIGRFGPRKWPSKSPDLNPLNFFYWKFIKDDVYAEKVDSVEKLRSRIINAFENLRTMGLDDDLFANVREKLERRVAVCIRRRGDRCGAIKND